MPASFRLAEALVRSGRTADAIAVLEYARTVAVRHGRARDVVTIDGGLSKLRR